MSLNPKQFRQQRLFNPLSVPRKQPHQMGLDEFAKSPRTVWHGSVLEDFKDIREDAGRRNPDGSDQGFHVGSLRSADDRSMARGGWLHPVRINPGALVNRRITKDQGTSWDEEDHGHLYENDYEDAGSISAILRDPHDVSTYEDHVKDAMADHRAGRNRIPSGEAEWRLETGNTSFQHRAVVVQKTDEVVRRGRNTPAGEKLGLQPSTVYKHHLRYLDPRTGSTVEDEPIPRPFRGEQGFMLEGTGTRAPRVRADFSKQQFDILDYTKPV